MLAFTHAGRNVCIQKTMHAAFCMIHKIMYMGG